jgi:hypothetical protein
MRRTLILVVGVIVAGLVGGCGGAVGNQPASSSSAPASTSPAGGDQVLVRYLRQGGIAGFRDELVVRENGAYVITGRHRSGGTGTLASNDLVELRRLLGSVDYGRLPTDSPLRIADGFTHEITYAGHRVRAGDGTIAPQLRPVIDALAQILTRYGT